MQAPFQTAADALIPPPGKPPGVLWRCLGALLSSRTSHGDTTVTLERVSFWLVLITAICTWWQGRDIPLTMASFLNVMVGAVFGQSALSTVGFVARKQAEVKLAAVDAAAGGASDGV